MMYVHLYITMLNLFLHEWKLKLFPYMVIMISYLVIVNYVTMDMEVQIHF